MAVGLAVFDRARLSARPQLHVLGCIRGTTSWVPLSIVRDAAQVPGILVVLFATPLWYANAVHFRAELERALTRGEGKPKVVILDALGMSDIDYTGSRALREALDNLDHQNIKFAMARVGSRVHEGLARSGLVERIGAANFFASVGEAVEAVGPSTGEG